MENTYYDKVLRILDKANEKQLKCVYCFLLGIFGREVN